jgi:hypothetical protein
MTQNEIDIITLSDWLITATGKAIPDKIAAIRQRLLDQLPNAADVDARPDSEHRAEFIEKMKGPKGASGVMPPSTAIPDGELRHDFIERQKRPTFPQGQVT